MSRIKRNAIVFGISEKEVEGIEEQCIIHHLITKDFLERFHESSPLAPRARIYGWTCQEYYAVIGRLADKGYNADAAWVGLNEILVPDPTRGG